MSPDCGEAVGSRGKQAGHLQQRGGDHRHARAHLRRHHVRAGGAHGRVCHEAHQERNRDAPLLLANRERPAYHPQHRHQHEHVRAQHERRPGEELEIPPDNDSDDCHRERHRDADAQQRFNHLSRHFRLAQADVEVAAAHDRLDEPSAGHETEHERERQSGRDASRRPHRVGPNDLDHEDREPRHGVNQCRCRSPREDCQGPARRRRPAVVGAECVPTERINALACCFRIAEAELALDTAVGVAERLDHCRCLPGIDEPWPHRPHGGHELVELWIDFGHAFGVQRHHSTCVHVTVLVPDLLSNAVTGPRFQPPPDSSDRSSERCR